MRLSETVGWPRGHPSDPLSDHEIESKAAAMIERVLSRNDGAELVERLWSLDSESSLARIGELFRKWSKTG